MSDRREREREIELHFSCQSLHSQPDNTTKIAMSYAAPVLSHPAVASTVTAKQFPDATTTTAISRFTPRSPFTISSSSRPITKLRVTSPANKSAAPSASKPAGETIFFDGGAHYGDLVANVIFGFTLLWLPLTLAAVLRAFYLRYRFTNLRVTVISGLTGQERSDFSYKVIKDVQVVPRFIGEWGDVIITLKDGTKVDLRSVPKFREIAKYCLSMARTGAGADQLDEETKPKGF